MGGEAKAMELREIERKWQQKWASARIFEADASAAKKKFYLNVAYPYPSGAMHVGHGRTYTVPDVIARFKRMQGFNVLFPMAFHVTGTPVIGISRRIARGDESAIHIYRDIYKVPEEELRNFTEPERIVSYFTAEYRRIMDEMGFSIDWRRCFTTVDAHYQKFIHWQYMRLKEGGFIAKGEHPVKFCPSCGNPVGDHDLLSGEGASILEFTLLKFRLKGEEDVFLPVATLRPETIFGVTNLWVNPSSEYIYAKVSRNSESGEETWIISKECAFKIKYQGYKVEVIEESEIKGEDLVGKFAVNPVNGEEVEILPASFVDVSFGTGIVMSVPAHAPYDFVALRDLHAQGKYLNIKPRKIIRCEALLRGLRGEAEATAEAAEAVPAEIVVKRLGIKNQEDSRLEKATEELYAMEFNKGEMLVQGYEGMPVREARERVKEALTEKGFASPMYEFSERPVVCRCNTPVVVSLLSDQWFLRYDDESWKERVRELLNRVNFVPPEIRVEFEETVDWLRAWACARRLGLGTKLPWDERWIVEPLSDSTIYMAYYTISHILREVDAEILDENAFNYIFLGEGSPAHAFEHAFERMRKEFLYWYPYDCRFSARDLVRNHLTFQLFHHVAIFPAEFHPRCIVVFGMATKDGKKMSSSKGNIVLLSDAIEKYGADAVRLFLLSAAEPWQDFDWNEEGAFAARKHVERFLNTASEIAEWTKDAKLLSAAGGGAEQGEQREQGGQRELEREVRKGEREEEQEQKGEGELRFEDLSGVERWLLSRVQQHIRATTDALEQFQCRRALQHAFFEFESDLRWFRRRTRWEQTQGAERERLRSVLRFVLDVWVRLLAPFIPHACEEIWSRMGKNPDGKQFVSLAAFPKASAALEDRKALLEEQFLSLVVEDVNEILKVTGISPQKIVLFVAPAWKREVFRSVLKMLADGKGVKEMLPALMREEHLRPHRKELPTLVKGIVERVQFLRAKMALGAEEVEELAGIEELSVLLAAREFLEREFKCRCEIYDADAVDESVDPKKRRKNAIPLRPAIFVL